VFEHALRWLPAEQPLYLLGDDTLARKQGKCVSLASMHHDPLLSTARKPFCSFGHVWVVLALWVPLPMGRGRGFALPLLVRLYTGAKRGGRADAPSRPTTGQRRRVADTAHATRDRRTKLELLRELVGLVAGWAPTRRFYLAVDSAYAGRALLEHRPPNVDVVSRLRGDAALWAPAPKRRPGQKGRPRRRGARLPTPQQVATRCRHWQTLVVTIYGRTVTTQVRPVRALWYTALRTQPVAIVLVRDPTGKRRDEAFFCTDPTATARFILEAYARRWTLEVTFHDAKQFLGFAEPQCQTPRAVQRTAPFALLVYDLVLLWFAEHAHATTGPTWAVRPWYRHKTGPSFADMLTALRGALGPPRFLEPTRPARRPANSPTPAPDRDGWAA
jgi:Transposase DDE domain